MKSFFSNQVGQSVPIVDCRNKKEVSFNLLKFDKFSLTQYLCVPFLSARGLTKSPSSSSFDLGLLEGQLDLSQNSSDSFSYPLISDSSRPREISPSPRYNFSQVWQDCSYLCSQTCFDLQKENSNFKNLCTPQPSHLGDNLSEHNFSKSIPTLIKLYFAATVHVTCDKKEEREVETASVSSCRIVNRASEYKHPLDNSENIVHQFSFMVDYIACDNNSNLVSMTSNSTRKMSVESLEYPNESKVGKEFSFECSKSMLCNIHPVNEVFSKTQARVCENFKAAKCISPQSVPVPETPPVQSPARMSSQSLQYVLFDRKKCTKKGRPSSKKQKKRKREKQKNSEKNNTDEVSKNSVATNYSNIPSCLNCNLSDVSSVISNCFCNDLLSSPTSNNLSPKHSSPPKSPEHVTTKLTAGLFILGRNNSTDSDCDDSDVSWDEDDWSDDGGDASGRSTANEDLLDLFTPCLYEINQKKASNINVCSESNVNSFVASFSFQPESLSDSEEDLDWSDDHEASDDDSSYPSDSLDSSDFFSSAGVKRKSLDEINQSWESMYCYDDSEAHSGDNVGLKVHFAEDLTTLYEVENFKTYFLDRARFKRRIEQAEPILTPVFDPRHRQAMFQRNLQLQTSVSSL